MLLYNNKNIMLYSVNALALDQNILEQKIRKSCKDCKDMALVLTILFARATDSIKTYKI